MKIEFYLRFRTIYGQYLAISGNTLSLGNDDPKKALPLTFLNQDFWHASIEVDPAEIHLIHYRYHFTNENGETIREGETARSFSLQRSETAHLVFVDTWNDAGAIENAFNTAPFQEVFFKERLQPKLKKSKSWTHFFRVKAPLLAPEECVCLLGAGPELGDWSASTPLLMERSGDWFNLRVQILDDQSPLTYKYGVYDLKKKTFLRFEEGDNRTLIKIPAPGVRIVAHDGFAHLPNQTWKGAGIAIPVFSLRSQNSFGVGEFSDLKLLADWAARTGMKLIQLLPVNDTSATFTASDSYPYAAISAFALHPVYINLQKVAGKKYAQALKSTGKKQKQLNALSELDYEAVIRFKMDMLRELFDLQEEEFSKETEYKDFFENNAHWLVPYAAFCYLRDKNSTADFNQWRSHNTYEETEISKLNSGRSKTARSIRFYYFVQYHLHLQLREAVSYAHKKGIVLKGDIPIGIYRNSVDAWQHPELFHMNWQAGAPPDDFAVKGQNWGFPTYNWQRMQEDGFSWWQQRFQQMSAYFDAFRIDHILGFFRIWSIPLDAVEGVLGRFIPALPITLHELGERGIWFEYDRFCKPFINDQILDETFGAQSGFVREHFLRSLDNGRYELKEEFATQQAIQLHFDSQEQDGSMTAIRNGLSDLVSNVLFFEEEGSNGIAFHLRIAMEQTSSFRHLEESTRQRLKDLYVDYFYRRQDQFWKEEALRKLPALKASTNMLVCGEDLGMVPHCVPSVMRGLGILSLEIQRMPKNPQTEFFHPRTAPYLSVITPSTHDMSTIRGWWEEDREKTQRFYNTILESPGEAPMHGEPWINRAIILQHLYAPAMWSIFQLQDLLGSSEDLRREDFEAERINQPADPKHYWRYRMHLSLEQLLHEEEFNSELRDFIQKSGRL